MEWIKQSQHKSRLGQLLVDRNLISEQQLADAIDQQKKTGELLGEIVTKWNLISHQQIESLLRKQRNLRLTATIVTAMLAPLQAYAATAAAATPVAPITQQSSQQNGSSSQRGSLRPLTEEELSSVSAQGLLSDNLNDWLKLNTQFSYSSPMNGIDSGLLNLTSKQTTGLQVLGDLATLLNPILMFLNADTTIRDVVYDHANAAATVNKDGSINLNLPSSIGEISFENIRVEGTSGASFGSVDIRNINLTGTTVTLKMH